MGLASEDTDTRGPPAQLDSVADEGVGLSDTRLTVRRGVNTQPGGEAVVTITAHGGVTHRRVRGALREVHAVREVVANAGVLNDHTVRVGHLAGIHVVAHPEATLEMLDPHVGDAGVRPSRSGEALVLRLLTVTGGQGRRHVEISHGHATHATV